MLTLCYYKPCHAAWLLPWSLMCLRWTRQPGRVASMDVDPIRDPQVRRAFPAELTASAERFFEHLLNRLESMTDAIRRNLLLLLLFGGLHYLLIKTGIDKASIGGFELTDLSLPRTILPAVIAFIFYEMASSLAVKGELQELCASVLRRTQPLVWEEGLLPALLPPQPALLGGELEPLKASALVKTARVFQMFVQIMVGAAPGLYVLWAVWLELTEFGSPGWEEWIAVAVALLLLIQATILIFTLPGKSSVVPRG